MFADFFFAGTCFCRLLKSRKNYTPLKFRATRKAKGLFLSILTARNANF